MKRNRVPLVEQHCIMDDDLQRDDGSAENGADECAPPAEGPADAPALDRVLSQGDSAPVLAVAVSGDGRRAVSGSRDGTVRVWDVESGRCLAKLKGHTDAVLGVAVSGDGRRALSASDGHTAWVWDLESGRCLAKLEGHTAPVRGVAVSGDGRRAVSGSDDRTLRVWDLETWHCMAMLGGHADCVLGVAVSGDGRRAVSGSLNGAARMWDLESGRCLATLESHAARVFGVAVSRDGRRAVSGSSDGTARVWDMESGRCLATLEGHAARVWCVAMDGDGRRAVSGSVDRTVRVWDLESGRCVATLKGHTGGVRGVAVSDDGRRVVSGSSDGTVRVWDLDALVRAAGGAPATRYTNAKVVLLGESGVGKTGLALRLCEDRWEATESTHGMNVSLLNLPAGSATPEVEREVWLWDFAGQPDYRLIHQLYMDETALAVLVFDPQDDNPFEALGHWEKAVRAVAKARGFAPEKLLVAGRCDRGGITISRKRFEEYCEQHGLRGLWMTGAKTGEGCAEVKAAIAAHIPWDRLPWTSTTRLFKALKDAILRLKEEEAPLIRLPELRRRLQMLLPGESVGADSVRAVVGLMQGQGMVQLLEFGDFVLLQPEQVNAYASVVVRMAREHVDEMGSVPEQQVLDGRLDYKEMKRLSEADELILLRAMVTTFLERALCLREETQKGTLLVFPSYFRRERPEQPGHPGVFVTYGFAGPLDEIYATLVVKLNYSQEFGKDQLWKDAADFHTPAGRRVGLALRRKSEGAAELVVYFERDVPDDTRVVFIKYVHEHLLARAQGVTRVRTYVCPHCDSPVENPQAILLRLGRGLRDIGCAACDGRVPLVDLIEEKFGSDEFRQRVREMDEKAKINLDNESLELILVGQAFAVAGEAGQIFRPTPNSDWGLDGEIEFKDEAGRARGRRVYLQLKSGDSYLRRRERDGAEVFTIKNPRHATYWQEQAYPVMLVIRTSDGKIRWMNVTDYLRRHGPETKQILFEGEPFTAENLRKMRDRLLPRG